MSPGLTPLITWEGHCTVAGVLVRPIEAGSTLGDPVWWILAEADSSGTPNNLIESGIRYGETPPHTRVMTPPVPLVAGQRYRLEIGWSHSASGIPVAGLEFTP